MAKALVIFSGGQDSTTCLYWARTQFESVIALTFSYGQRHIREIESAQRIAALTGVPHQIVDMGPVFSGTSPLINSSHEIEQYESADTLPGGLETTFVPGRNILFLSVAAGRAYIEECNTLVIGVSQEDFGGYPDCRADFINKMQAALSSGLDRPVKIEAPLMHLSKAETVEFARKLPGCLEALAYSTTCYNGSFPPCLSCHACLLRTRGFEEAGREDPLLARAKVSPGGGSAPR